MNDWWYEGMPIAKIVELKYIRPTHIRWNVFLPFKIIYSLIRGRFLYRLRTDFPFKYLWHLLSRGQKFAQEKRPKKQHDVNSISSDSVSNESNLAVDSFRFQHGTVSLVRILTCLSPALLRALSNSISHLHMCNYHAASPKLMPTITVIQNRMAITSVKRTDSLKVTKNIYKFQCRKTQQSWMWVITQQQHNINIPGVFYSG